jgi:curved DNA-binding protein CbpA
MPVATRARLLVVSDLYDELGVEPSAPVAEIRRAYRRRAQELHPDHQRDPTYEELTAALQATARLNHAWEVLSDPGRRADYDASLGDPAPARDAAHHDGLPNLPPRRISMLPWLILAAVMLAIFVFTAYAGPHSGPRNPSTPTGSAVARTPLTP